MATLKQTVVTSRIKEMLGTGMSKRQVARELGVSYGVVSHIKTGRTKTVSGATAEKTFERAEHVRKHGAGRLYVWNEEGRSRAPGSKFSRPTPATDADRNRILAYREAVDRFMATGDTRALKPFEGKTYRYATPEGVKTATFETDPDRLNQIGETEYEDVQDKYEPHESYT